MDRRTFARIGAGWLLSGLLPEMPGAVRAGFPWFWDEPHHKEEPTPFPRPENGAGRVDESVDGADEEDALFLTFDDGPLDCTSTILDHLGETRQKATFFIVGRRLEIPRLRKIALRAVGEGHDLGNHSLTHTSFASLSPEKISEEIRVTHELIEAVTREAEAGQREVQHYFRYPFGRTGNQARTEAAESTLRELGYRTAWWDVDTGDWKMHRFGARSEAEVMAALGAVRPRDVILLHDRPRTAEMLPAVFQVFKAGNVNSLGMSSYDVRWTKSWDRIFGRREHFLEFVE
jgi:peptidoglycan-N-acetylglucosamine deacetylase